MKEILKSNKNVIFQDLGLISYKDAWEYQEKLLDEVVAVKMHNRKITEEDKQLPQKHYLLFCAHPPVYTLGKSGSEEHLLMDKERLKQENIEYFKINRGGDITFHGPGQIVGYPIFDLDCFFTDVHKYVRYLEEAVIRTLAEYAIAATRIPDYTGVWIAGKDGLPNRKICAIGVHLRRWVTMHGFALNVNTKLSYFNNIIPCGISAENTAVTSIAQEIEHPVNKADVKEKLKRHFAELFDFTFVEDVSQDLR